MLWGLEKLLGLEGLLWGKCALLRDWCLLGPLGSLLGHLWLELKWGLDSSLLNNLLGLLNGQGLDWGLEDALGRLLDARTPSSGRLDVLLG